MISPSLDAPVITNSGVRSAAPDRNLHCTLELCAADSVAGEGISKLTFIPRAGFTGTVSIPYTATNADGTKFTGQISINVEEAYSSAYFNDLGSCNTETLAAIDFLSSQNIVNGVSA